MSTHSSPVCPRVAAPRFRAAAQTSGRRSGHLVPRGPRRRGASTSEKRRASHGRAAQLPVCRTSGGSTPQSTSININFTGSHLLCISSATLLWWRTNLGAYRPLEGDQSEGITREKNWAAKKMSTWPLASECINQTTQTICLSKANQSCHPFSLKCNGNLRAIRWPGIWHDSPGCRLSTGHWRADECWQRSARARVC